MANEAVVIHAAKLPATGDKSNLLIRPADGITTSADPERAGWRYLSFHSFALATGETAVVPHPEDEAIIITLGGGGIQIDYASAPAMDLPGRMSVFAGLPWAAYIPPRAGAVVTGRPWATGGRSVIALAQAPASGRAGASLAPVLIGPEDVEIEVRGAEHATRQITNIVMPGFPADRLLCCEVHTPAANWSGWPAHKHDVDDMPREAVLEETYHFQFARPEGFGLFGMYLKDGRPDAFWAARHGDLILVTEGYHPFSAIPGCDAYYLNFLAGDRRTMQASDDPDTTWIREAWKAMEPDPRVPLVSGAEVHPG
jgi:5-deoxy-glucuronate isomerase